MNTHDENHDEPMFMAISDDDEALLAAVQMAKETLPHFKAAFSKSQYSAAYIEDYSVKYRSLVVVALVFVSSEDRL